MVCLYHWFIIRSYFCFWKIGPYIQKCSKWPQKCLKGVQKCLKSKIREILASYI